jgi:DNA-binding LytR/AlgR family response regulator
MNVAVCDDEQVYIDRIKARIKGKDAQVYEFLRGKDLLESNIKFDIVFLDIDMEGINEGFEIAEKLLLKNKTCILVFVTSHFEFVLQGYRYRAFRYILKSDDNAAIQRDINAAFDEFYRKNKKIDFSYKGKKASLFYSEIQYLEAHNHVVSAFTDERQEYSWTAKLQDIEPQFKEYGFVRCHRSYLINLHFVDTLEGNSFCLKDGKQIPIGRKYKESAKDEYVNFRVDFN